VKASFLVWNLSQNFSDVEENKPLQKAINNFEDIEALLPFASLRISRHQFFIVGTGIFNTTANVSRQ